jgi:hypothetical protein
MAVMQAAWFKAHYNLRRVYHYQSSRLGCQDLQRYNKTFSLAFLLYKIGDVVKSRWLLM